MNDLMEKHAQREFSKAIENMSIEDLKDGLRAIAELLYLAGYKAGGQYATNAIAKLGKPS